MFLFCTDTQKQKWAEYQKERENYNNYLNSNATLDPTQVMQGLHLNSSAESYDVEDLQPADKVDQYGRWYNTSRSGDFMRVTYNHPVQSSYVDFDGTVHKIGKVVVTYSDLVCGPQATKWKSTLFAPTNEIGVVDSWYIKSVTATYDFYDDNGNLIDFQPGSAWLFLSSLGRWSDYKDTTKLQDTSKDHVEGVQGVSGIKMYAIPNGGATIHDGNNAYADPGPHTQGDGSEYQADNPYDHQQAAVIGYISNGVKLRWNLDQNYDPNDGNNPQDSLRLENGNVHQDAGDGGWYYWRLVQSYDGFKILKPENTEVHYHYNQAENRYYESRIIFSIIFWLSLSANSLTMCT
ncbi:hypothetical protein LMC05_04300 [Limosilactobacillus reuteri]|uniref:hypothetical protein n=1 Tax=Limosilactobacillus reuteri TaxID=1598 RepID=UPI001E4F3801|nr:hypothetical protein [Limosilactobacillus reuteri]MCC4508228.1 hypothetical protein [Limosilactobacillus reuteri]